MSGSWSDLARVPMQQVRGCLVASVQVELTHDVLHRFQQDLLQAVRDTRARAVILSVPRGAASRSNLARMLDTVLAERPCRVIVYTPAPPEVGGAAKSPEPEMVK